MAMVIIPQLLRIGENSSGLLAEDGETVPVIARGPLLKELDERRGRAIDGSGVADTYELARWIAARRNTEAFLAEIDRAGVRGRGGGGYPAAHKWFLLARQPGKSKYFVCNAHALPGDLKVPHLLSTFPRAVVEAVAIGSLLSGAETAFLAIPSWHSELVQVLRRAVAEAELAGLLGERAFGGRARLDFRLFETPVEYIVGEETALLEAIEGRPPIPRGKPPLPTSAGLLGSPTAVSSLETVLQAWLALRIGAAEYRRFGTETSPGTMLFTLRGAVERTGLYELPLGIEIRQLIFEHGGGTRGREIKLVFPGGLSSPPVGADALETRLDYDAMYDAGSHLGSGSVIAVSADVPIPELALELARFFHDVSCGKCRPCSDGTGRTTTMLERLDELDRKSIDLAGRSMPKPKRRYALRVLGQTDLMAPSGISYTDMTNGLGKIEELCEFYKHRGDCHHPVEAASVVQRLIDLSRPEFEACLTQPAVVHATQ